MLGLSITSLAMNVQFYEKVFFLAFIHLFRKSNAIFAKQKMNNGKQLKQKLNDNPEFWRAADDVYI